MCAWMLTALLSFSAAGTVYGSPGACLDNYDGNVSSSGEVRMLVFLVSFSDIGYDGREDLPGGSYDGFDEGVAQSLFGTGEFSLTTVMRNASGGALSVSGDVHKVTLPYPRSEYESVINQSFERYLSGIQNRYSQAVAAAEAGDPGALQAMGYNVSGEFSLYSDMAGSADDGDDWEDDGEYDAESDDFIDDSEEGEYSDTEYYYESEEYDDPADLEEYTATDDDEIYAEADYEEDGQGEPSSDADPGILAGEWGFGEDSEPLAQFRQLRAVSVINTAGSRSEKVRYTGNLTSEMPAAEETTVPAAEETTVPAAGETTVPLSGDTAVPADGKTADLSGITETFCRMLDDTLKQAVSEGVVTEQDLKERYTNGKGYVTPILLLPYVEGVTYPEAWRGFTGVYSEKTGAAGENPEAEGEEPRIGRFIMCDDMPLTGMNEYGENYNGLFLATVCHEFGHTLGLPDLYTESEAVLTEMLLSEGYIRDPLYEEGDPLMDEEDLYGYEEDWDEAGDYMEEDWDEAGDYAEEDWEDAGDYAEEDWDETGDYMEEDWDDAGDYMDEGEDWSEETADGFDETLTAPEIVPVQVIMNSSQGDFSAFSKLMLNWISDEEMEACKPSGDPITIRLSSAQKETGIRALVIPRDITAEDPLGGEYILIEYDTDDGNVAAWDKIHTEAPLAGVRIMHIDGTMAECPEDAYMNREFLYEAPGSSANGRTLCRFYQDGRPVGTGAVVASMTAAGAVPGFCWYDEAGMETVDTGLTVTVGETARDYCDVTISVNK